MPTLLAQLADSFADMVRTQDVRTTKRYTALKLHIKGSLVSNDILKVTNIPMGPLNFSDRYKALRKLNSPETRPFENIRLGLKNKILILVEGPESPSSSNIKVNINAALMLKDELSMALFI